MRRHRVAVLLNDMNVAGGIQRVAANLVRDLRGRHDVMLLSVEPLHNPVFFEQGLEFKSLDFRRRGCTYPTLLLEYVKAGKRLRKFVREHNVDIVLAIWYDWASVASLALPRSVMKIGCEHISYGEATRVWQWIRRFTYPCLDAVVGLTKEDLPSLAKIARSVHVIPNSIRQTHISPQDQREKLLLTIGHLITRKGIDRLLWALKGPLHAHPDWKLAIVGGGEKSHVDWGYLDYVSGLIHLLQLEHRVEFHPATKHIDHWYRRAAVYVMGSRQEGLPMVLIEAKAYGLPIISFDCPTGPKEIVRHGMDGFLIQDDSHEFGEAANTLMSDPELWRRMSAAAIDDVKARFSVKVITEKWCDLIESLHRDRCTAELDRAMKQQQDVV